MKRLWSVVAVLTIALLCGPGVSGADQKQADDKKPAPGKKPAKGRRLPNYWKSLNLKDDQKEKVYTIDAKYSGQIKDLRQQLTALIKKRQTERESVLTAAQKTRLQEMTAAKKKGKKSSAKEKKPKKSKKKGKKDKKDTSTPEKDKKTGPKDKQQ